MRSRLGPVTAFLSVSALAGCGGGGPGNESSGGSPAHHETPITAYADASPQWCSEWRKTIAGMKVFSSNPDGSLLNEATTDGSGQATLLTVDGGYVSAAFLNSDIAPELQTYAVEPSAGAIEFAFPSNNMCFPAAMHVHVEVTPVTSWHPIVEVCNAWAPIDSTNWTAEIDFTPCSYDGTFTVALTNDSEGLLAVSPRIPYVGGGTANVSLGPPPPVAKIEELSVKTNALDLFAAYSNVDVGGMPLSWVTDYSTAQVGPDARVTWAVRPAPGVRIQMRHEGDGCEGPSWSTDLDTSVVAGEITKLDPGRLAQPVRQGDGTWTLDGGDLGDAVIVVRTWGDPANEIRWTEWLSADKIVALPDLVLPASIAKIIPAGPEKRIEVDNEDVREAASFAELIALTAPSKFGPTYVRERNTGCWSN